MIRQHLTIEAEDNAEYDLKQHFDLTTDFISKWLRHGNVYVHCQAGISRSCAVVMAFLIREMGMKPMQALRAVKSSKRNVSPNKGFFQQLCQFESELAAPKKK